MLRECFESAKRRRTATPPPGARPKPGPEHKASAGNPLLEPGVGDANIDDDDEEDTAPPPTQKAGGQGPCKGKGKDNFAREVGPF